jgi:hypothetical protein
LPAEKLALNFGRYHALVIGNNAYTDLSPLKTAVNDATAVAELLQTMYGFTVTLLTNTTRDEIITALDQLRATLTEQDNSSSTMLAMACWTQRRAGILAACQCETRLAHSVDLNTTITDALKAMAAKHILVVADSCYSGTLVRGLDVVRPPSGGERDTYLVRLHEALAHRPHVRGLSRSRTWRRQGTFSVRQSVFDGPSGKS